MSWHKRSHDVSKHGESPAKADVVKQHRVASLWALATFSAVLLLVSACVLVLCCPMPHLSDNPNAPHRNFVRNVGATHIQSVCPVRLSLPDSAQYGDSQYNESEGDLQSFARYGAFGDVYRAGVHNLRDSEDQSTFLNTQASDSDISALVAKGNVDHDAQVLDGRLSRVAPGTGIAASMVSWATQGDVRGLAATACSNLVMKQAFLVPESGPGISLRLEAFNPASKPTVVRVRAWSAKHGSTPLTLSTGSAFTVPARSHAFFDLAAAAPQSAGLYVQADSEQTPVAAFIKVVHMSGLTVKGVDIIRALRPASHMSVLPGLSQSDKAKVYVWSEKSGKVTLSWMEDTGYKAIKELSLSSRKLQIVDLGEVPENVHALSVSGSVATAAMVSVVRDGKDGQSDVAFINANRSNGMSVVVSPMSPDETTLHIASTSNQDASVQMRAFDASGVLVGEKHITIHGNSAVSIPASYLARRAVMFEVQSHSSISWGARIRSNEVDNAGVAGVAWIASQSLEPQQMQVFVVDNHHIVY